MRQQIANTLHTDLSAGERIAARPRHLQLRLRAFFHQRLRRIQHSGVGEIASAHGCVHIVNGWHMYFVGHATVIHTGQGQATKLAFQQVSAGIHVVLAGLRLEPLLHLGPRPRGAQVAQTGL